MKNIKKIYENFHFFVFFGVEIFNNFEKACFRNGVFIAALLRGAF